MREFSFRLHDLGGGRHAEAEGTGKEELGGMTHPSPLFLPTSAQSPENGRQKPSSQGGGWQRLMPVARVCVWLAAMVSADLPSAGAAPTEETALLLPLLAPHPDLGFCTAAGTFSPAQEPAKAGPCAPASGDPMVQALSPGRSQLFFVFFLS